MLCQETKKDGTPCKATAIEGKTFCWNHDPANADRRQRIAARGGKARPNREIAGLKTKVKDVIERLEAKELDAKDANAIFQGYRLLKDFIEQERKDKETEQVIEELEELRDLVERLTDRAG